MAMVDERAARRAARHARHPGPLRRRAALRPASTAQAQLPRGRRGARRHRRGRPPPRQAGRRRPSATRPATASTPPDRASPSDAAPSRVEHPAVARSIASRRRVASGTWRPVATCLDARRRGGRVPAEQQPDWPDEAALERALKQIAALSAARVRRRGPQPHRRARRRSPRARRSCSRPATAPSRSTTSRPTPSATSCKVILQMAVVLTYSLGRAGVKVGRIAGQFAKPRSAPTETRRRRRAAVVPRPHRQRHRASPRRPASPDPERLVQAYHQSASTLNLLRAFTKGGFADLSPGARVEPGVRRHAAPRAGATSSSPTRSTGRCGSCRPAASTPRPTPQLHEVDFYTSHEALILGYEEALTRQDSLTGDWYDCSAHMLWIGERTRQLDGAHVEFLARRRQPDRLQARARRRRPTRCSRSASALNPDRMPGPAHARSAAWAPTTSTTRLPPLLARGRATPATRWCGPATRCTATRSRRRAGRKTRHFDDIMRRDRRLLRAPTAPRARGRAACTSSSPATTSPSASAAPTRSSTADLDDRYETMCDPRLNARQSLDLAFRVAELLRR